MKSTTLYETRINTERVDESITVAKLWSNRDQKNKQGHNHMGDSYDLGHTQIHILDAHHYNPWFVYFLPHFSMWFILWSGLQYRAVNMS